MRRRSSLPATASNVPRSSCSRGKRTSRSPRSTRIFRAVVTSVCDDLLATAERALEAPGSLEERLAAFLSAKFTRYWELVQVSPHAQELIRSQGALGAEIIQGLDRAYLKLMIKALDDARVEIDPKRMGMSSTAAAHVLLRAASGVAYDATSAANHRKHLAELVRVIVAALRRR
jgi:hypothetical protein